MFKVFKNLNNVRYPVAILANMIFFALNLLLLFTEIFLSKREKLDAVRNVFQKLEGESFSKTEIFKG